MSHMSELAAEEEYDRYHDQCDEPEYSQQEHEDNKGCLICHQRREEA